MSRNLRAYYERHADRFALAAETFRAMLAQAPDADTDTRQAWRRSADELAQLATDYRRTAAQIIPRQ